MEPLKRGHIYAELECPITGLNLMAGENVTIRCIPQKSGIFNPAFMLSTRNKSDEKDGRMKNHNLGDI